MTFAELKELERTAREAGLDAVVLVVPRPPGDGETMRFGGRYGPLCEILSYNGKTTALRVPLLGLRTFIRRLEGQPRGQA